MKTEFGSLIAFYINFKNKLNLGTLDNSRGFIDQELNLIHDHIVSKNIGEAHIRLFKFRLLHKDILLLESNNCRHLKKYLTTLINAPKSQYYGTRLEIRTATYFTEMELNYTCPDPPDFLVNFNGIEIHIECTSKHFTSEKDEEDVIKGFKTCIEKKSEYNWIDENSVLFIDSTNLSSHNSLLFSPKGSNATRQYLKSELSKTKYGSLIAFEYIVNSINNRYEHTYNRIDSDAIGKPLKGFLDKYFELGNFSIPEGNIIGHPDLG